MQLKLNTDITIDDIRFDYTYFVNNGDGGNIDKKSTVWYKNVKNDELFELDIPHNAYRLIFFKYKNMIYEYFF